MRTGELMFLLLQNVSEVRLTPQGVETFLMRAGRLVMIREISKDDFNYLLHLLSFKIHKVKGTIV